MEIRRDTYRSWEEWFKRIVLEKSDVNTSLIHMERPERPVVISFDEWLTTTDCSNLLMFYFRHKVYKHLHKYILTYTSAAILILIKLWKIHAIEFCTAFIFSQSGIADM